LRHKKLLTGHRYWAEYNKGLTKLANDGKTAGVLIAQGCGHFIQVDDPGFVAGEVVKMIERVGW
jgi:pimeloyl-ACP methyl ester carboxylesterase